MAFEDVYERALEEAEQQGTIDFDDTERMQEFREDFDALMEGRDHFPSAEEVGEENWDNWIDFLNEYDLWEEFREDWEKDYAEAA